jgi:flagellar biosynthesis protein
MSDEPDYLNVVALRYQENSSAPQVVAKGRGLVAEEIIRRAKEAGVFVHESKELVSLLMQVDLDQHIPPQLYLAVAELLAWVYHVEHQSEHKYNDQPPSLVDLLPKEK